jgi:hypothetical protein
MRHLAWPLLFAGPALIWSAGGAVAQKNKNPNDDLKSNLVVLESLKSMAPAEWKKEKRANLLRVCQFRLPKVKDDKLDGEVVILDNVRGKADENIKRWQKWFVPPDGKTIDDVSKIEKLKVAKKDAHYLDVAGTYLYKERPNLPDSAAVPRPGHRMLAVYLDTGDNTYFIRMIGPADTVAQYKKGFDDWLKAFK